MLIDVDAQAVGNHGEFSVYAKLLQGELLLAGRIRHTAVGPLGAQIAAYPNGIHEPAGPTIQGLVQGAGGEQRLRVNGAEGVAQSAAGGVDVAGIAFEAFLNREVGFGAHGGGRQLCQ